MQSTGNYDRTGRELLLMFHLVALQQLAACSCIQLPSSEACQACTDLAGFGGSMFTAGFQGVARSFLCSMVCCLEIIRIEHDCNRVVPSRTDSSVLSSL